MTGDGQRFLKTQERITGLENPLVIRETSREKRMLFTFEICITRALPAL